MHAADNEPNAAAVYCDCQLSGITNYLEFAPSIQGEPLDRMFQYIEGLSSAAPVRGLIRTEAIRQAGPVRSDEFRAPMEVFVWLAKLLRWGSFRRVGEPLYYRLDHPRSFSNNYYRLLKDRKRAILIMLFTEMLDADLPVCRTPEERLFFQETILHQIAGRSTRHEPNSSRKLMAECLELLQYEGNTHWLRFEEIPAILRGLQLRREAEQSQIRKMIYRMRQQSQIARFIYPNSLKRRVTYQVGGLLERAKRKIGRLLQKAKRKITMMVTLR